MSTSVSIPSAAESASHHAPLLAESAEVEHRRLWARVLASLERHPAVTRASFSAWLKHTRLLEQRGNVFIVGAQHSFAREKLERGFREVLEEALRTCAGQADARVQFQVAGQRSQADLPVATRQAPAGRTLQHGQGNGTRSDADVAFIPAGTPPLLHARFTFATFVTGKENKFACAAARAVAENPGLAYNPLFLYGGHGLGKTHLLHAIGQHALTLNPALHVHYLSAHTFGRGQANNGANGARSVQPLASYAVADILLLDDLQLLGHQSVQEDLLHLLHLLDVEDKQVVFAADRPPRALEHVDERLRSRFQTGLVADLAPLGLESRMALLRSKAEARGVGVSLPVIEHIARRVQGSVRELEGALTRVLAEVELGRVPLSVDGAAATLSNTQGTRGRPRPTMEQVLLAVSTAFGASAESLLGKRRDKDTALARQVAMYLMREETGASFSEIGNFLGQRDHTTVLHGHEKIATALARDERLRAHVEAARALFRDVPRP